MNTHTRPDSARCQARIHVPNITGPASVLVRSLGTADREAATARATALQTLANDILTPDMRLLKRRVEDVFVAAGVRLPLISWDALPEMILVPAFVESFLARKGGKVTAGRLTLSTRILRGFGRLHKTLELQQVQGHHVQAWLDALVRRALAPRTICNALRLVSSLFRHGVAMGHIKVNPCLDLELPVWRDVVARLPMADGDFEKLLAHLGQASEWRTAALLGRYAGLRLQDAAKLSGEAVMLTGEACLVAVTAGKTGRSDVLPVFGPLVGHLRAVARPGPLTPALAALSADRLSKAFTAICDAAGIDPQIIEVGNGRKCRRVSFHSLRHSFVTDLSKRGVPEHLRKKMSAHVTSAAHRLYDHAGALDLHKQVAGYFA